MRVSGTRVLLTGASGGIGNALATVFAEAGASLVLSGRREVELEGLAARMQRMGATADLTDQLGVAGKDKR